MSPYPLPIADLALGRFVEEDPIVLALHHHQCVWADLPCDGFKEWKENVAQLCAPALKEMARCVPNKRVDSERTLHRPLNKSVDPSPSRVASPLFEEPTHAAFRPFTDPVAMEPAVERLFAAARGSSPLTVSVAKLMASARAAPLFTEPVAPLKEPVAKLMAPVAKLMAPVAKLFAAARSSRYASPLFVEPIPAPVAEVKHAYFATSSTIVPAAHTIPSPFVPQAPSGIKTIIARNLPRTITPQELRERFQLYGVVRDVYLPRNKDPNSVHHGTIRGFALIKYDTAAESDRAVRGLSALGLSIRDKQVTVEFAKSDTATRT
jgi:hypothetical protein